MKLLLLAYVASAAASEQCQEQSHSPHLHKVDARGRIYVGCGDGVHVLSRDGELLGKIKLPGKDPAANLAFGKGKHRSTLYVLDETSVTAVELPGTRGARVGRERKFDVGRARYKSQ